MNIIFVLKTFESGGVEIVTTFLANKFVEEGHHVSVFAFLDSENTVKDRLNKKVKVYTLSQLKCSSENINSMRTVMIKDKVHIVINQWGLPFVPLKTALRAAKGLNVKFISVYHNTPEMNGRIQSVNDELAKTSAKLIRLMLKLERFIFKEFTSYGMRWNYYHSDVYMVLSPSFIDKFKSFTGIKHPAKLIVQTNPVTIDSRNFILDFTKKKKEILYVGRLDNSQKKVNRVIETWAKLEAKIPDWRLTIIGVGPSKHDIEKQVKDLNLKKVFFEGFQQPKAYYERASILMLTSDFEGFPLVLAEAMSFGVIPVVLGSYSAVYDIINDGENGYILPYNKDIGFDADAMASKLVSLMQFDKKFKEMSSAALDKSRCFSIDTIYSEWEKILKSLI